MSLFGPRRDLKRRERSDAIAEASRITRESKERRRSVAHNMVGPARASTKEISGNNQPIDRQLTQLERLRGQVSENYTKHAELMTETRRLREQRKGLRMMQKASKRGVRVK